MTITIHAQDSAKQFTALENLRLLSQAGFKRFDVVDTSQGRRIRLRKGGVVGRELPQVLNDVAGMYNKKDDSGWVVFRDGHEESYGDWLSRIAQAPTGADDLEALRTHVMRRPLSNYYALASTPRYPQLLKEIDAAQQSVQASSPTLATAALEAAADRHALLGNPSKAIEITDITDSLTTGNHPLSSDDLKQIYDANLAPFDLETTGLNAQKNAISEISALRVVQGVNGSYRVLHFHAFCSPEKPEIESYNDALAYDRKKYEYDISLDAMGVTDTQYERAGDTGRIIGMKVSGKEVAFVPFYKALESYEAFRKGAFQTAYNAPFDLPFQLAKIRESNPAHDDSTVPLSTSNPAHYICQMLLTMRHMGQWPANNLDNAYRMLVDPTFAGRAAHLGFEDNVMLIKITSQLLKHYNKPMSVLAIYQDLMDGIVDKESVTADDKGNITIRFPNNPETISEKAKQFWQFARDLNEAKLRSTGIPQNLLSFIQNGMQRAPQPSGKAADAQLPTPQAGEYAMTINAQSANPLVFKFLSKLMMLNDTIDKGVVSNISFFDSSGKADITLPVSAGKTPVVIEDVPLGSIRLNYQYLAQHPENLETNINMIKRLSTMRNVGLVSLSDQNVEIRSFQRSFGKVNFSIPKGSVPSEHLEKILDNIQFLSSIGGIPGVVSATQEWNEDSDEIETPNAETNKNQSTGVIETRVAMDRPDEIAMEISPALTQCLLYANLGQFPNGISSKLNADGSQILSGTKEAFERFKNTIKDASWLLHRVRRLPGTHSFSLAKDGTMTLNQDWGVSIEAIQILTKAAIPFSMTRDEIRIHIDSLMKDAYRYSGNIERASEELKRNASRSVTNQEPAPAYLVDLQESLWGVNRDKNVQTMCAEMVDIDRNGRIRVKPQGSQTSYEVQPDLRGHIHLQKDDKHQIITTSSTLASVGSIVISGAPCDYVIDLKEQPEGKIPAKKKKTALDEVWEMIQPDLPMGAVRDADGAITISHALFEKYNTDIKRKRSLQVSEKPSTNARLSASQPVLVQIWQQLEADGKTASCKKQDGYIQMPKEMAVHYQQQAMPLGKALHTIESMMGNSFFRLQSLKEEGDHISFQLPTVPTVKTMEYVHQLEQVKPKFSSLAKGIAESTLAMAHNLPEHLYDARRGSAKKLLEHLEKQLPAIDRIHTDLRQLLDEKTQGDATQNYFTALKDAMPKHQYQLDAAVGLLSCDGVSDYLSRRSQSVASAAGSLAETLSKAGFHIENMQQQDDALATAVARTRMAMCELYLVMAGEQPEHKDDYTAKARELFDAVQVQDDSANKKWDKMIASAGEDKDNPYTLFQAHKKLIRAVQVGENNLNDTLTDLKRHTNQSQGALDYLANMLSPAPGKGSFVRDELPKLEGMVNDFHVNALVRGLCAKTIPFSLQDGKLTLLKADVMRLSGQSPETPKGVTIPTHEFMDGVMKYIPVPASHVDYNGQSITLRVDDNSRMTKPVELNIPINEIMPKALIARLEAASRGANMSRA